MAHQKISRYRNAAVIWWVTFIITMLLLLCCAFLVRPAIRARYLLNELETLQLGHSTFEDAQRLAKKIGAHPVNTPCSRSSCELEVRMGNSALPEWWRGAGEAFVVSYNVKDGIVMRKNTGYGIGIETNTFFPSSVGLEEQENWGYSRRRVPVEAGWMSSNLYRYYIFHVYMTPKASAEDRKRFTSYNFSCFWKYKGCKDGRELLPISATFPTPQ